MPCTRCTFAPAPDRESACVRSFAQTDDFHINSSPVQGFEDNKVLYDSVQYSSKGLGADEFGLWGVYVRPRIFFVMLINAIFIVAKWIGYWTSPYWLDPQHEWQLPLLLLSAYTMGLVSLAPLHSPPPEIQACAETMHITICAES